MILVTGGTGFVGSHLLFHLINKGEEVSAIKRPTSTTKLTKKVFQWYSNNHEVLFKKIKWIDGDLLDYDSLIVALRGVDYVYHAAAVVSFNPSDKIRLMQTNVEGTSNLVNASLAANIKKLCYVSSIAALGRAATTEFTTEETEWKDVPGTSNYSRSKHRAELEVWRAMAEGLKVVIVNPSIILGPGNWNEGSVKMFQTVYRGLKFYTSGRNGYVDVNDLVKAMILLMEGDFVNERYLINAENIRYQALFTWMSDAFHIPPPKIKAGKILSELSWRGLKIMSLLTGKAPLITKETARTARADYRYSNKKIKAATGMIFKPIKQTIQETVRIYLKDQ